LAGNRVLDSRDEARRPVRPRQRSKTRRRWAIAGAVLVCWLITDRLTGSYVTAAIVLVVMAGLGVASVAGLRAMGVTPDHPWLRRIAARPWRDGSDVLHVATRNLPSVFIVTPNGSLLAPDVVELQMNPADLASVRDLMGLDVVSADLTAIYEEQVAKHEARFAGSWRPEVYIVPDVDLPQGRYRLRRGLPAGARANEQYANEQYADQEYDGHEYDGQQYDGQEYAGYADRTRYEALPGQTVMDGMATVMEQIRPAVPLLRLVTGSSVAETKMSGARAGRGTVELALPDVPTVSRVHARFTFADGRWWVTNQGVNGMSVNGAKISDEHPLSDGDSIRWGTAPDAPMSRVEIG
jgi:hypothetical protein